MSKRQLMSSGSPFEPEIGFSRGVRIGAHIAVVIDLRIATYFEQMGTAILSLAVLWALLLGTLQVMWQDRRAKRMNAATASRPT